MKLDDVCWEILQHAITGVAGMEMIADVAREASAGPQILKPAV